MKAREARQMVADLLARCSSQELAAFEFYKDRMDEFRNSAAVTAIPVSDKFWSDAITRLERSSTGTVVFDQYCRLQRDHHARWKERVTSIHGVVTM